MARDLELEIELASALDAARRRWHEASEVCGAAKDLVDDIGKKEHCDGTMAMQQYIAARLSMVEASEAFRLALRAFADEVVHKRSV